MTSTKVLVILRSGVPVRLASYAERGPWRDPDWRVTTARPPFGARAPPSVLVVERTGMPNT